MFKYYMTIDGDTYNALFLDHFEAADFLDANDRDGAKTIVNKVEEISIEKALDDADFGLTYVAEVVCLFLLGREECRKRFRKTDDFITYLRIRGYLN